MSPPAPTPTISLKVEPTAIVAGQSATLTWSAGSATACTASGAWIGIQPTSGTMAVTPATAGANTYTLNCTDTMSGAYGSSSSATQSVTLTVNAATAFVQKTLVADTASGTATVDANLVNPWGLAVLPNAFFLVDTTHTEISTLYDGNGVPQPAA